MFPTSSKWFLLIMVCIVSCKKEAGKASLEDGASTVMYDLAGDTGASMGGGVDGKQQRPFYPFLFRFSDSRQIWLKTAADSATYLRSTDWDLCFSDVYNSLVSCNGGSIVANPGYGGPGQSTGIVMIDKPYREVTQAPADDVFAAQAYSGTGWDSGNGFGWFFYSLSNHLCTPIKNRTFVMRTALGKFAKFEILNIYQGNPPAVTDLNWPAPYFTFRYFVQEDGSRNLSTP
jgi:hypothetical protein